MKCNISAWCRQTLTDHAKKRIAGFGLLCTLLLAGILSSCTDDEFPEAGMNAMQTISDLRATNPRGLVQQPDGTWMSQKCRVPIVGPGRIVTYIDGESVDVGVADNNKIENAVDTDLSNYTTTSTKIVNVDVNAYTPIISIRDTHHTYSAGQKVGFIFKETREGLLTADVLDGMTIQTFLHGSDDPQETIVAKGGGNSLLNLNLLSITSNGGVISDREISFEATKNFDEVRLCLHGIDADVISSSMDISVKYAFVGENREIRATSEDEFKDYWSSGAPTIGKNNIIEDVGNIVDSDIGNSAPFTSEILVFTSFATVNFHKTIPAGTEIGFRYSSVNVASISLLGEYAPTISTYDDKGKEMESSTPNKDLLGIGLIRNTQNAYISIQTTKPCTQVRFTHPSELLNLGGMNVYYAYVREPVKLDPVYSLTLTGGITHLCEGDPASIPVESTTLPGGYALSLAWTNRDNEKTGTTNCTLSEDGKFLQVDGAESWEEGRYYVDILQGEEHLYAEVYVHPKETTWEPQDNSTDWNTWENWTNGVPWDCSNVFIPANVEKYPVLSASGTEEYWCNNIHFAPGAELIGQSHLHYKQAFVDMNLSSGAYHLISAPLQDMVTGDMFVAQNVNDWEKWRETSSDGQLPNYFMPINGEKQGNGDNSAYIEQRINPYIYQRFWNSAVRNETLTRAYNTKDKAITEFTDWSRSFNAVETNYKVGQGFALKAGDGTNASYHFHFPKSFSIYNYYGINGNSLKGSSIARTGQTGRLWTAEQINGLTLKRETSGTLYIFGNPFMAHINIEKFLNANSSVSSVKVYKDGQYVDITSSNVAGAQIAPMQAVFLTATAGTKLHITLSEDMLEQGKPSTRLTRRMANQVRLTATSNRHSASCVVVSSSSGNDKFNSREDVTLLVGSEEGSGVAVYTIADGKALSIQRMKSATRIPVGFYLKQAGNVSLTFDASDDIWNSWRLKDQQTGRSYPIKGRITLNDVSTGSGRFFLEKVQ